MSKVNKLKIQDHWRAILRAVKAEDLRKEIDMLSQNHEREVDRKEAIIQMLDRDLDEAEEQNQMALRSHLQNVDTLIELQANRLRALESEFQAEVDTIQDEFNTERTQIMEKHEKDKQELLDIMVMMEREHQEHENEVNTDFQSQKDEIKNKTSEEYNVLRIILESRIDTLGSHFENAHKAYLSNTEVRTQAFRLLTADDHKHAKTIEQQMRKLARKQDEIAHWKTKMYNNIRECEERNKALREEKDAIAKHFQELKARMNNFRQNEAKRLAELTTNARGAVLSLTEKEKRAERILKLAELNVKAESERERVLPFYQSTVAADEVEDEDEDDVEDPSRPETLQSRVVDENGRKVGEWDALNNFFKRYNKVLLDKTAIEKEKQRLTNENQELRVILKKYLDGISVNDDVMGTENPLLVVNNRTNEIRRAPVVSTEVTVIDGNKEVANNRLVA